jgi:pre-mRNA 3'-end-processing factor FIP1
VAPFQNFAGIPEDQLSALPPELRTMVMTGATAMMNNNAANATMMGGMNPMMDMSGMGGMNMGPMGMGMNGDMGMQMQQGGPMMPDGQGQGPGTGGTPDQGVQMGMQDGYGPGGQGPGMMGMGMGGDFGIQVGSISTREIYVSNL